MRKRKEKKKENKTKEKTKRKEEGKGMQKVCSQILERECPPSL